MLLYSLSLALHQAALLLLGQETAVAEKERVRLQQKTLAKSVPGRCRRRSCESGLPAIENPRFGASGDRYGAGLKTLLSNEINWLSSRGGGFSTLLHTPKYVSSLAFRVLESFPGAGLAVLLALLGSRVSRKEPVFFEKGAEIWVYFEKCFGDAVFNRARLT